MSGQQSAISDEQSAVSLGVATSLADCSSLIADC